MLGYLANTRLLAIVTLATITFWPLLFTPCLHAQAPASKAADPVYFGPLEESFQVNETGFYFFDSSVARDSQGGFVIVWQRSYLDSEDERIEAIYGRRLGSDGLALGNEFMVKAPSAESAIEPVVSTDADDDFVVVW